MKTLNAGSMTVLACALLIFAASGGSAQSRIVFNNQQLFLDGSNIAWVNFAGDLGPNPVDTASFRTVFDSIHAHGGNALRFWLHTTGGSTPQFSPGGAVTGPGVHAIADLKLILAMAWQRKIGLLLSLWSFDMMDTSLARVVTNRSQLMLTDTTFTMYYVNNALVPIVDSLRGNPGIIGWEIFNEAEGMTNEFGWSTTYHVPMADIQMFVNRCAGAIHREDPSAKVTTGAWALTAETDVNGLAKSGELQARLASLSAAEKSQIEGEFTARYGFRMTAEDLIRKFAAGPNLNYYRDDRLIASGGDPLGTLDFYTDHYYTWQSTPISPFVHPYSAWQLTKPLVIAEFFPEQTLALPYTALYDTLYANGYAGALSWGWYSGASGHSQAVLQANTLALTQELFSRYPEDIDPVPVAGNVYSFTARPSPIDSGQTSLLDWKTALGTTAAINGSSVPVRGTMLVSPHATTPYRLIASGLVTDTATVTVTVYPSGKIISFGSSATRVGTGDPVIFRWNVAHGSAVTLNDSTVTRIDSILIHPASTRTYTLIASGSIRDTASILLTVVSQDQINRALTTFVDVSSSSTLPPFANPESMTDGDTATQWASLPANSQWIVCHLGQSYILKRVIVRWGGNFATAYRLSTSPDNSTWTVPRAGTSTTGGTTIIDSINQAAAFVALYLDTRDSGATGFAIREFEVYGIPNPLSVAQGGAGLPDRFALMQNYPNPFNPSTTIAFALPVQSRVSITIYNVVGQRVAELVNGEIEAGYHAVVWNAAAASGVYFCRMEAASAGTPGRQFRQTMKVIVVR